MSTTNVKDPLALEIARLRAENARLTAEAQSAKAKGESKVTMSVSSKGALSIYGLGRFPVTLYPAQWSKLLAQSNAITAFIEEGTKLGAFATSKDAPFVQPNQLPLKFIAKQAKAMEGKAGAAF